MAIKLIDSTKETACRTAEADAIRAKTGGTAPLTFDFENGKGFADAIAAIQSGGITPAGSITLTEEGSFNVTTKAQAVVDFSSTRASLAEAVTAKGVDTLPTASFDAIATNIALIEGGGGGVTTPWVSIDTTDIVVGANSVSNPVNATAYFEQTVGAGNVIGAFLKSEKTEYEYSELIYMVGNMLSAGSSANGFAGKRYRNGLNDFLPTTGYDVKLVEGSTYQVLYFTHKP